MGMKDLFKKKDSLTQELSMLPRDTKKRILENVSRRRSEIIQERLLESQMNSFGPEKDSKKRSWGQVREGMQKRRKELTDKGILKPLVRVNRENFKSPMEEASKRARAKEIKGIENQRNRMKSGSLLESNMGMKMNDIKLKIPEGDSLLKKRKPNSLRDGII